MKKNWLSRSSIIKKEENTVRKFTDKFKANLDQYLDLYNSGLKISNDRRLLITKFILNEKYYSTDQSDFQIYEKEIVILNKEDLSVSNEFSLLIADLTETIKDFRKNIKNSNADFMELSYLQKFVLKFKRKTEIVGRENNKLYCFNNVAVIEFRSVITKFFGFLEDILQKKQAKNLFLVRREFIIPHSVSVFAFSDRSIFGAVPMDVILNLLGLDRQKIFNMFEKLLSLSQSDRTISDIRAKKRIKLNETPSENSAKNKKNLEIHF